MPINRTTFTFLVSLLLGFGIIVWVIHRVERQSMNAGSPVGWQAADTPRDRDAPVDPWLLPADAWTEASIPTISEICPELPEGDEVHAVADGVVIFSGLRHGRHAVILGHRSPSGIRFESIYEPLAGIRSRPGKMIGRGMILGQRGSEPLRPILRDIPQGIREVPFGKSELAMKLEQPGSDDWMSLEIGNAEKMLELKD